MHPLLLVVSKAQSYEIPGARTDPAAKLGSDEVRPGNEPAVRHFMDRTIVPSDFCLRWSGTLRIDCGRAVLPRPVCRFPRVVHLHRPWRCGIHPFCFSAPGAGIESDGDDEHHRLHIGRTFSFRDAELLDRRYGPLLLPGIVHSSTSDDSGHICHLPSIPNASGAWSYRSEICAVALIACDSIVAAA